MELRILNKLCLMIFALSLLGGCKGKSQNTAVLSDDQKLHYARFYDSYRRGEINEKVLLPVLGSEIEVAIVGTDGDNYCGFGLQPNGASYRVWIVGDGNYIYNWKGEELLFLIDSRNMNALERARNGAKSN